MIIILILTIPLLSALISLFIKKKVAALNYIAISASSLEFISAMKIIALVARNGSYDFTEYFSVTYLGAILVLILGIVGLAASWYSTGYLSTEVSKGIIGFRRVRQYFVLLHFFLAAMFFAVTTSNPILMWIAIEATTLSTAFLISFYNKPTAMEAAWKYLVINSVGLLLAFFGTLLFLYPAMKAGYFGLANWNLIFSYASSFDPFIVKIAFILVVIGYGTKVGLAPMHTWLPDAHSKAPAPISALLSGVLLNVAFFAVLKFKAITDAAIGSTFSSQILIFFGVISIVIAAFIIYIQKSYKRLLAYSSIEHMGVAALGFGFGGPGAAAALLHMIYHSLTKSILFLSAGNIFVKYGSTKIKNIRGVISALPVTGVLFVIGFLAITGVPPFGIFGTEFGILASGMKNYLPAVIIILFALVIVFAGFLKHISDMVFGEPDNDTVRGEGNIWTVFPIIILAVILIVAGFYIPAPIKLIINSAALAY